MKSLFGLSAIVALGSANLHEGHKHFVMEPLPAHEKQKVIARGQKAQKKMKSKMLAKGYPTSPEEHKAMAKSGKLHPRLQSTESTLDSKYFEVYLGIMTGTLFSPYTTGPCFQATQTSAYVQAYIIDNSLRQIWKPTAINDLYIDGIAFIEIGAEQFEYCNVNEAVSNAAEIFTVNGVSTLAGRATGDVLSGNYGEWIDMYLQGDTSMKSEAAGKFMASILNYRNR